MATDGLDPQEHNALADVLGRLRVVRAEVLESADVVDATVRDLLAGMDLSRTDPEHERMIDAIMGVCRAADAARAFAHNDFDTAGEATESMGYYARRALGEAA
jgi:hypothetical protein